MNEIKTELSEITKILEKLSSEDQILVQWKLADLKKDILQLKFYVKDIEYTLATHKKSVANK